MNNSPLHHTCDSAKIAFVRYDEDRKELLVCFKSVSAKTGLTTHSTYRYFDVPPHHFGNIVTAKSREKAIGKENPKSEGSYIIHHISGLDRKNPPFRFEKLTPEEVSKL